ncbi:hypothetical protein PR003_g13925 [Phytophthora rubi]|uniref:Thioredoxin domain-containing protein n=1 Tax=Phytophthora rubi TaxID=129364 RepID=A0A6A4F4B8_9STRA|nr:hypothetical protein PR001_g4843 [Phytophthora rubi]KAE9333637.1 hypothetical protein PR003_g13925 [Phytophthora rubi]
MPPKAGGHHYASRNSARRRRWMVVVGVGFTIYCVIILQMRLWSAASYADMRANAISAERGPLDIPPVKQDDDIKRVAQEVVEVVQQPSNVQAVDTTRAAKPAVPTNDQQNLRARAPLSTPGVVIVSTPAPTTPIVATSVVTSGPPVATTKSASSFAVRHDVVSGYDAAMKYLSNYTTPAGSDEQLFLFFVCGDEQGQQTTWRRVCVEASDLVYDVFAKSPSRNRLLTIHAGSKQDWSTPNAFFKDGDLKVKMIPAIMQWHGGRPGAKRATSGMIIEESLLYEPLLRYLFKNEDTPDPHLAPDKISSKGIVLLKGYKNYRQYMDGIAAGENPSLTLPQGPMFLFLVAGRLESNDRPWCPYCRYSEISIEYAFYAFAPPGSRLVKVETVNSYGMWKTPTNEWRQDTALMVRGVPWLYQATFDSQTRAFSFERYYERFDYPDAMRGVFQGWKNPL